MIGRVPAKRSNLALAGSALLVAVVMVACGPDYYEIPIETPIQAKLDVSPFQRVLVAGFVSGGSDDVDANQETVRLLRSQLRTKSQLRVIDADILPLIEVAQENARPAVNAEEPVVNGREGSAPNGNDHGTAQTVPLPQRIKDEGRCHQIRQHSEIVEIRQITIELGRQLAIACFESAIKLQHLCPQGFGFDRRLIPQFDLSKVRDGEGLKLDKTAEADAL